jgi:hypothetical protein
MLAYHQSSVLEVFTCSRKEKKRCKNNISGSIHMFKKREEKIQKQYIRIGSIIVMIEDAG